MRSAADDGGAGFERGHHLRCPASAHPLLLLPQQLPPLRQHCQMRAAEIILVQTEFSLRIAGHVDGEEADIPAI